jgi:uncharacterized membrane protein HdeD (DUF308 family)
MSEHPESIASGLLDGIKQNARMAVITGVILLICGILSIGAPFAAGVSITILVGLLLVVGGVTQCVLAFQAGAFGKGLLIFVLGAITAIAGIYLLNQPVAGLAAITLFLAGYFIAVGIVELIAAFQIRPADGWGWMLFNAIVTLILGIMIWRQFPLSGAWAVGVLFGIKMIMSGWALIFIGRSVRGAAKEAGA